MYVQAKVQAMLKGVVVVVMHFDVMMMHTGQKSTFCTKIIENVSFEFSRQKWHFFSSIVNF